MNGTFTVLKQGYNEIIKLFPYLKPQCDSILNLVDATAITLVAYIDHGSHTMALFLATPNPAFSHKWQVRNTVVSCKFSQYPSCCGLYIIHAMESLFYSSSMEDRRRAVIMLFKNYKRDGRSLMFNCRRIELIDRSYGETPFMHQEFVDVLMASKHRKGEPVVETFENHNTNHILTRYRFEFTCSSLVTLVEGL